MTIFVTILSVACLVATAAVLAVGLLLVGRHGPTGPSVQYAVTAGVAEVGASAMYLVWLNGGGTLALAAANTLLVLGPVMVAVAFATMRPTAAGRARVIVASACVVAVTAASLLLSPHEAALTRVVAFAVICACAAVNAARSPEAHRRSIRVITAAVAVFALYCAARAAVILASGPAPAPLDGIFSDAGAILIGAAVVIATSSGTVAFWIGVRIESQRELVRRAAALIVVTAPDDGIRGLPRHLELVQEVREAALAVDVHAVPVVDGAGLSDPDAAPILVESLRVDHGWNSAELALLKLPPVAVDEPLPDTDRAAPER